MVTLDEILNEATKDGRICPKPRQWDRIWKALPNRKRKGGGWSPPLPLVLSGWWYSDDDEKRQRFKEHIFWAYEHNSLDKIAGIIFNLKPDDWHTGK